MWRDVAVSRVSGVRTRFIRLLLIRRSPQTSVWEVRFHICGTSSFFPPSSSLVLLLSSFFFHHNFFLLPSSSSSSYALPSFFLLSSSFVFLPSSFFFLFFLRPSFFLLFSFFLLPSSSFVFVFYNNVVKVFSVQHFGLSFIWNCSFSVFDVRTQVTFCFLCFFTSSRCVNLNTLTSPLKCFLCTEVKDKVEVLVLNIRPSEHAELQTNKQWFSSVELWKQLQRWVMEVKYQRAACVSFNRSPTVNALLKWVFEATWGRWQRNKEPTAELYNLREILMIPVKQWEDAGPNTCSFYISDTCFRRVTPLNSCCSLETADINISSAGHSVSGAFLRGMSTKTWNTLNIQPVIVSLYKHCIYLDTCCRISGCGRLKQDWKKTPNTVVMKNSWFKLPKNLNCKCPRPARKTWFCRHKCSSELMKLI